MVTGLAGILTKGQDPSKLHIQTKFLPEPAAKGNVLTDKKELLVRITVRYQLWSGEWPSLTRPDYGDVYVPLAFFKKSEQPRKLQYDIKELLNVAKRQISDWAAVVEARCVSLDWPITKEQFYKTIQGQKQRDWENRQEVDKYCF